MAEDQMINMMVEEIQDMLPNWEKICLEMEAIPTFDNYDEIFRMAHNIKGTAKMFGFEQFGDFIHKVEDLISLLKNKTQQKEKLHVEIFLETHSIILDWITQLRENPAYLPNFVLLLAKIQTLTTTNAKNTALTIAEDLVFSSLPQIMEQYFSRGLIRDNQPKVVKICGQAADTAGVQLILSLMKSPNVHLDLSYAGPDIIQKMKVLETDDKIFNVVKKINPNTTEL